VLFDFRNRDGVRLQGILALPDDYKPGEKRPMLVSFYEKNSANMHRYSAPNFLTGMGAVPMEAVSRGYITMLPDIHFRTGASHSDMLECVEAATRKVIELGYADPKRIGLQGHSWGGYQSSFIVTQTDLFAAVVTGAPPTNLVSFYNTLYKSTGTVQQGIMELGQVRMGAGATPWTAHELYESQSPLHHAPNIKTPFMILHGTVDNAVDWSQGLEFYAAARRWGKNVIFLSYPGEPHHLQRRENQKDFQIRMKQFFDHYALGTPAPKWMTEGVPQVRKGLTGQQ
jgi:dipeptidyl aminopeptidase/acylaminoacyl peptidase